MYRYSLIAWMSLTLVTVAQAAGRDVDYVAEVKPILKAKCYSCHGALKQQSKLRLDHRSLMVRGGDSGAAIVPGAAKRSRLFKRITAGPVDRMPPADEGSPLSAAEISVIQRWIDQGAKAPRESIPKTAEKHWSFQQLVRPQVPSVSNKSWLRNPIDAFVANQHQRHGLTPQPAADRLVLLRRLYFDLIGLPPSAEQIASAQRSDRWYERTVDQLLSDPRHGQRWARHWMDIWRYSDWEEFAGQLRYSQKHIWHWRDWIVESLNGDTPYDEMIRLMIAADELHPNDLSRLRATGYLARNYFLFNRNQWMENVVEHVGKGFLGLTFKCAKCHDHKYDPIKQRDFYAMRAFFEPYHVRVDMVPSQLDLKLNGVPRVYDGRLNKPTYLYVGGAESRADKSSAIAPNVPSLFAFGKLQIQRVSLPATAWQPQRRQWVINAYRSAAKAKVAKAEDNYQRSKGKQQRAVAKLGVELAKAELNSLDLRIEVMQASKPRSKNNGSIVAALGKTERDKISDAIRSERRVVFVRAEHAVAAAELALARAAAKQRQAARSKLSAARKSLQAAGKRLKSPIRGRDKYTQLIGAKWTATRFNQSTKDDPRPEFSPYSTGRRTALAKWITDKRNPLTARVAVNHIWTRHMGTPLVPSVFDFGRNGKLPTNRALLDWLAVELIESGWSMKHLHRLIVNSATYRLSSASSSAKNLAKDRDNRYWWRRKPLRLESQLVRDALLAHAGSLDPSGGGPSIATAAQNKSRRRSLYFFHSKDNRNKFLMVFDEAAVTECYRREQSVVPQQALALSHSQLVLEMAPQIAKQLAKGMTSDQDFVRKAFQTLLGMSVGDAEVSASVAALQKWQKLPMASNKTRGYFVWALINHNDFVTIR